MLNSMYVQNLYYSKKTNEALEFIDTINDDDLSDIMLLYKIKGPVFSCRVWGCMAIFLKPIIVSIRV